ncbi:MAG: response regulator transcription factor [Clostridia bacterium]|nr:response regulator transcription factor [Clostridia bacterium]
MVHIAIVDNDTSYVSQVKQYLTEYEKESGEIIEVSEFSDGDSIVHSYRSQFDIIIMDIEMRFMDGMSAAEEIRKVDSEVVIIFMTQNPHYAIRAYSVGALDYLLKPVTYFTFSQCITRAIGHAKRKKPRAITISIKGGIARFDARDVYYVESRGHNMIYHTATGDYESTATMKETEERLQGMNFFRASKWYLINLAHVEGIHDGYAKLVGKTLTVSRARKKEFMDALIAYWN